MAKIILLDENIINQIAAGEVIERPSSIVKELIENSIDANASSITVEIKEGGISFIKVFDNGDGIEKEDIKNAFLLHATSKIKNIDDLENILTLGFRGEALASIASVSQVTIVSKTEKEKLGTELEIRGGDIISNKNVSFVRGTSITVRNLFYNTPGRRKFLKKISTESSYISDIINKFILAHPNISFKYIVNDTKILDFAGNKDLKNAIFTIYGKNVFNNLIEINCKNKEFELKGYIGKSEISRKNRRYGILFLNGRFIKNKIVQNAMEDAFKTRLPIGKFPFYVLNLYINPSLVDVNVHPRKLEVRFDNEDNLYDFILNSVNKTLKNINLIPNYRDLNMSNSLKKIYYKENIENNLEKLEDSEKNNIKGRSFDKENIKNIFEEDNIENKSFDKENIKNIFGKDNIENRNFEKENIKNIFEEDNIENNYLENKKEIFDKEIIKNYKENNVFNNTYSNIDLIKSFYKKDKEYSYYKVGENDFYNDCNNIIAEDRRKIFSNYKIVGQILNTYWIVEEDSTIYMIDQHVAHERILYENLIKEYEKDKIVSQKLLVPEIIKISMIEKDTIETNIKLIEKLGFEIEIISEDSISIKSVPFILKNVINFDFFLDILDKLTDIDRSIKNIYDTKLHEISTISCKAAIKANDKLSYIEIKNIIDQLLKLDNPFTCPHGRPIIIKFKKYDIEKLFSRV